MKLIVEIDIPDVEAEDALMPTRGWVIDGVAIVDRAFLTPNEADDDFYDFKLIGVRDD